MDNPTLTSLFRLVEIGVLAKEDFSEVILPNQELGLDSLCDQLVGRGRLTRYQADVICNRRSGVLVIGNYIILDTLAAGVMGVMHKAYDAELQREVSIKMLPSAGKPTEVGRFRRKAIACAQTKHKSFLTTYAAGRYEGQPYLVMEYVQGRDLGSLVRKGDKLPVAEAVNYILQASIGMSYAHRRGIIHCDLKPSNLLLVSPDEADIHPGEYLEVKILDIGLASIVQSPGRDEGASSQESDQPATGMLMGTVDYMAPEQAMDSSRADHRSDIYSLGCTLYFLLTKKLVYTGSNLLERVTAHLKAAIPSLRDARPEVPEELDAVFQKMVAKKPRDRYQSMQEVVEALQKIDRQLSRPQGGQTIEFGPDGFPVSASSKRPQPVRKVLSHADPPVQSRGKTSSTGWLANLSDSEGNRGDGGGSSHYGWSFPEEPGGPTLQRGDFEESEWKKRDIVDCTVFAPPIISPYQAALVQVFCHVPQEARAALAAAQEFDEDAKRRGSTTLGTLIERGSKLTFEFRAKDLFVDDPSRELIWSGRTASVQFAVSIGTATKPGTTVGTIFISQDTVPIGKIQFKITIENAGRTPPPAIPPGEAHRYQQAFISYASKDRSEVLRRVQMLKAVGIRFFQDMFDLREGDQWEPILFQRISESDVFFLFWSQSAKQSKWVEREWQYALQNKGDAFIHPIAIEGPPIPAPPHELAHIHFGDMILYFLPRPRCYTLRRFLRQLLNRG